MQTHSKLSETVQNMLCCPICKTKLELYDKYLQCRNIQCHALFPIINDIPIIIDDNNSIFSISYFINNQDTAFYLHKNKFEEIMIKLIPGIDRNIKSRENYERLRKLFLSQSSTPKVLVIGGSILGEGMEALIHPDIALVESDVSFGPRTELVFDAHSIPFEDSSFDGIIVQAVLEHVVDPWRCVEEIHRVLKEDGLVYAETPFMQQVHGGRYDFTRFTHLGHRRLFRKFEEIDSGAICGSAMALAWSYRYFLLSFTTSSFLRRLIGAFARLTSFFLTYLDYLLIDKPGTLDAASGYYFIGKKSNQVLPDKSLVQLYQGLDQT